MADALTELLNDPEGEQDDDDETEGPLTLEIEDKATAKLLYQALASDDRDRLAGDEERRRELMDTLSEWHEERS